MNKKTSKAPYWVNNPTSKRLWEAYQRMMAGEPCVVAKTARMTLSSVATEAGYQRSTLSRRRFPDLAELIDKSASGKPGKTMHALYKEKQQANRNLRLKLQEMDEQRSVLLNQLAALESRHLSTLEKLERFNGLDSERRVVPISGDQSQSW